MELLVSPVTMSSVAIAWLLLAGPTFGAEGSPMSTNTNTVTRISPRLAVYHGSINVGIVLDGVAAVLIDCAEGVGDALKQLGVAGVRHILFTHWHRDQACGAHELAASGAQIGVPRDEAGAFTDPAAWWRDDGNRWRVYRDFSRQRLMLAEPIGMDSTWGDRDEFVWGAPAEAPARIHVLSTPGHTDGAVSYLVDVDGKRVLFSGDCIYGEGQLWDVYSLQKGFARDGREIGGYHGFMGDHPALIASLKRIKDAKPDRLVPSHGRPMDDPARNVDALVDRLERCYENYVSISALRHYFPELFTEFAGRPGQMPVRPGIPAPECLRHFGTTWMLVSETGAALVMDAGSPRVVDELKKKLKRGTIKSVDGLWVTHYHFDHTAGIPAFQEAFDCPCITDRQLAEVLTNPAAWRLPCLAPEPIRVERPMEDGQSWAWNEFRLTSYFYPGQTLYHAALLVERGDLRMFFVGDSHTMAGNDDYCAYNRNLLGREVGFQYCLSLIEKLRPTHIFNCHVNDAFTYTPDEIAFMRKTLDARERLFGELVPWDHANYGLDPSWVRCAPYAQAVGPGDTVKFDVFVTNHSRVPHVSACRAALPKVLGGGKTAWVEDQLAAKAEQGLSLSFRVPADVPPGRYVVLIDVRHGPWNLPRFAETMVDVVTP